MSGQLLNGAPQAQMVIAAPFNDVQMIALVAAQAGGQTAPADAVTWAVEIVAEACVQGQTLPALIRAKAREAAERQ